jgi:hypothetical protein
MPEREEDVTSEEKDLLGEISQVSQNRCRVIMVEIIDDINWWIMVKNVALPLPGLLLSLSCGSIDFLFGYVSTLIFFHLLVNLLPHHFFKGLSLFPFSLFLLVLKGLYRLQYPSSKQYSMLFSDILNSQLKKNLLVETNNVHIHTLLVDCMIDRQINLFLSV